MFAKGLKPMAQNHFSYDVNDGLKLEKRNRFLYYFLSAAMLTKTLLIINVFVPPLIE